MSTTFVNLQAYLNDRINGYGDLVWSDALKKRYLNDGVNEFCRITHILHKQSDVTVVADDALYVWPTVTGVASVLRVWRASWDGTVLGVTNTSELDRYIGTGWRDAVGSEPQYILTDTEDTSQIRIYPMVDTIAQVGTNVLTIEYSYLPTEMDGTVTTCPLPDRYCRAPIEWAVAMCFENEVQSKQNPGMGDRALQRFFNMAGSARAEVNRGMFYNRNTHVIPSRV